MPGPVPRIRGVGDSDPHPAVVERFTLDVPVGAPVIPVVAFDDERLTCFVGCAPAIVVGVIARVDAQLPGLPLFSSPIVFGNLLEVGGKLFALIEHSPASDRVQRVLATLIQIEAVGLFTGTVVVDEEQHSVLVAVQC